MVQIAKQIFQIILLLVLLIRNALQIRTSILIWFHKQVLNQINRKSIRSILYEMVLSLLKLMNYYSLDAAFLYKNYRLLCKYFFLEAKPLDFIKQISFLIFLIEQLNYSYLHYNFALALLDN